MAQVHLPGSGFSKQAKLIAMLNYFCNLNSVIKKGVLLYTALILCLISQVVINLKWRTGMPFIKDSLRNPNVTNNTFTLSMSAITISDSDIRFW